jgi:hypothetical protein
MNHFFFIFCHSVAEKSATILVIFTIIYNKNEFFKTFFFANLGYPLKNTHLPFVNILLR